MTSPLRPGRRDGGLAVADPAVVRRHAAVGEDAEAVRLEPAARRREQAQVLERPAGEDDGAWLAGVGAGGRRRGGDRFVERGGDLRARPPRSEIVVHRQHERPAVAEAPLVRLGVRVAGEQLELDRRLALVRHLVAHAEQGRDRVEEAAHARRQRRVHVQARAHLRPPLPRHRPPRALEVRGSRAPGLSDRRLAARQRHRLQPGEPLELDEVAAEQLPAPEHAVRSVTRAVEDERQAGPVWPCSARQAAACAWWCCTPTSSASCSSAHFVARYSGCRSYAITSGRTPWPCIYRVRSLWNARYASSVSRSPRCGERNASRPCATQNVLFSSAPAATIGRRAGTGRGRAAGTNPRERRTGNAARSTESSQRRWISRSWLRNTSAMPPSRSRASSLP